MSKNNNGGPAYPMPIAANVHGFATTGEYSGDTGMTLRDWFAGQALIGVTTALTQGIRHCDIPKAATDCFAIADAMLKARDE